jgi:hypothetical protein
MKKTITTCCLASLTALLLSACGGKGFLGDRNDALEGNDAGSDSASQAPNASSDDTASPSGDDSDTAAAGGGVDANGEAEPTDVEGPGDNSVDPTLSPDPSSDEGNAEPTESPDEADTSEPSGVEPTDAESEDMGSEGSAEPTEGGGDSSEPSDVYEPCDGKSCGESCNSCAPDALCLSAPGYCSADGECSADVPLCAEPACPVGCAIPKICQLCDDGETCAEAIVSCNEDGSCGDVIDWVCPDAPPEPTCPESCPTTDICQLCDDGATCATPIIECNEDGSCGEISDWSCPETECKTTADCGTYDGDSVCLECATETGDPAFAPPVEPLPASKQCTHYECIENTCKVKAPTCDKYDPCAGKTDGDSCTLCAPDDAACTELTVEKVCDRQLRHRDEQVKCAAQ